MNEHAEPPVLEVTIAAPVEVVWRSLREPDLIKTWHGWHVDSLDDEVQMIFVDNVTVDEAAHVFQAGDQDTFECTAVPGGTRVRITRPVYRPNEEWSAYYDEVTEGWQTFLQQLKFMHELHPGEPRRTIALMGEGSPAGTSALWEQTPSPLGADWFSTPTQRGVLLPELGPGLVIIATKPTGAEQVFAMTVVTTYGLDDAAFETERERWTDWWRAAFPAAEPAQV